MRIKDVGLVLKKWKRAGIGFHMNRLTSITIPINSVAISHPKSGGSQIS
jgi:hypothetical protein